MREFMPGTVNIDKLMSSYDLEEKLLLSLN